MFYKEYISINNLVLHQVGNVSSSDGIHYSDCELNIDSDFKDLLKSHFLSPFKTEEYYNFTHSSEVALNEIYEYATRIFLKQEDFLSVSKKIAKYLYECSTHPNIKRGELYVVYFKDCIIEGETVDAVGLFKSETKDRFIKVYTTSNGFELEENEGISINKIDKGCLIFNVEKEKGYLVAIVDNTNKGSEAKYWTDSFLKVRLRRDGYSQTQNLLSICKKFVSQLPEENGKAEKASYINRSVGALKGESCNIDSFAEQVFENSKLACEFIEYKELYEREHDIIIDDSFIPSENALKRKSTRNLTTIKLDQNFDIYIHGGEQCIVRGFDAARGMNYYQLFFNIEK